MGDAPPEAPWYAGGLRFHCTACGECCTGVPGYVWITADDLARMASVLADTLIRNGLVSTE